MTLLFLAAQAFAADTWVYYHPTYISASTLLPLTSALADAGASVTTTTSASWPTSYSSYKLVIILLPNAGFSAAQAKALETYVNGGGRLVISGDWAPSFDGYNAYIDNLFGQMGVPMSLNSTTINPTGCGYISTVGVDSITSGVKHIYMSAGTTITGGTALFTYAGNTVVAVSQPSSATHGRAPYDVVVSADVNVLLDNGCGDEDASGSNYTFWYNLYPGCSDDDGDGHSDDACGGDDCDDTDADIYPGAPEYCNGYDDDCDGTADEAGAIGTATYYQDDDGDGYGDPGTAKVSCSKPSGYVSNNDDCDDADPTVHPGATEVCNDYDDDCDGKIDESGSVGEVTWYRDADSDGYGATAPKITSCDEPSGYVANDDDCDDLDADVHPGATEIPYDGLDQDCDGEDLLDVDGDGYDAEFAGGDDCDDGDNDVHPDAVESGDGVDEDCDGSLDEETTWGDDDHDGVTEVGGDCDDADPDAHPGAEETADGTDEDCDGVVDDGMANHDDDGDGYSETDGDCNDIDPLVHPGGAEVLDNGVDDDCDGTVDDGLLDDDGDGYTEEGGDCAPKDGLVHPGAEELADGIDNDCDGEIDEGTTFGDDDGDGASEEEGDCDDDDDSVRPGAAEVENGRDDDCDGEIDEETDAVDDDGDGYSELGGDCDDDDVNVSPDADELPDNGVDDDCDGDADEGGDDADGDGYSPEDGDCDDQNGWARPGLAEVCDGLDNNCDGDVDEGCSDTAGDTGFGKGEDCGCAAVDGGASGAATALLAAAALLRRRRR